MWIAVVRIDPADADVQQVARLSHPRELEDAGATQAAEELDTSRNSRSAFSQSSTSCPSSRPRSQYSSNARRAMSLSLTSDAIASAVGDSTTDGIDNTLSVLRLADFGIMHLPDFLDNHNRNTCRRRGLGHRPHTTERQTY